MDNRSREIKGRKIDNVKISIGQTFREVCLQLDLLYCVIERGHRLICFLASLGYVICDLDTCQPCAEDERMPVRGIIAR